MFWNANTKGCVLHIKHNHLFRIETIFCSSARFLFSELWPKLDDYEQTIKASLVTQTNNSNDLIFSPLHPFEHIPKEQSGFLWSVKNAMRTLTKWSVMGKEKGSRELHENLAHTISSELNGNMFPSSSFKQRHLFVCCTISASLAYPAFRFLLQFSWFQLTILFRCCCFWCQVWLKKAKDMLYN